MSGFLHPAARDGSLLRNVAEGAPLQNAVKANGQLVSPQGAQMRSLPSPVGMINF